MKYPTIFHLIAELAERNAVSVVLIGGFAVNHYKVTRQTADVDFLITKEGFEKILGQLEKEGFKKGYSQEVFAQLSAPDAYLMDIDFMFVGRDTLAKIIAEAQETSIAGKKFMVPSLRHLIALKLHAIKYNPGIREYKDLTDIIELIKVNALRYKDDEFKVLCLRYGSEELYRKILERL